MSDVSAEVTVVITNHGGYVGLPSPLPSRPVRAIKTFGNGDPMYRIYGEDLESIGAEEGCFGAEEGYVFFGYEVAEI